MILFLFLTSYLFTHTCFISINRARMDQKDALATMMMTTTRPARPKEEKERAAPRAMTMMPTTAEALDEVVEAVEVTDKQERSWYYSS